MDTRFVRAWQEIDERRTSGLRLDLVLAQVPTRDLIAALAGVGDTDPVAANAIATELLNRERRAPYRGAFLVSFTLLVLVFLIDFALSETPLWRLSSGAFGYALAGVTALLALVSAAILLLARGRLRLPPLRRERRY